MALTPIQGWSAGLSREHSLGLCQPCRLLGSDKGRFQNLSPAWGMVGAQEKQLEGIALRRGLVHHPSAQGP